MSEIFGMIDLETIEKLAGIVSKNELSELSLSDGDKTITVKGKKNVVYESQTQKNVKPVIESDATTLTRTARKCTQSGVLLRARRRNNR